MKTGRLLDSTGTILTPIPKKDLLAGKDKATDIGLMVDKKLTYREARSFLFSGELMTRIRNHVNGSSGSDKERTEQLVYIK